MKALTELCDYVEKQVINEDNRISFRENLDEMNLEDVRPSLNNMLVAGVLRRGYKRYSLCLRGFQ